VESPPHWKDLPKNCPRWIEKPCDLKTPTGNVLYNFSSPIGILIEVFIITERKNSSGALNEIGV